MSALAIRAEALGKQYRIGQREPYKALRDVLTDALYAPFRRGARRAAPERRIWALKDVSFEVEHGEVVGIIGRNGAGKSTALKILARITEPTEGYAEVHGRMGSLLEVGTGFHTELTGRENIYFNGSMLGMRRAEIRRKFDDIVGFAEIERFIDTPVKHYSSGMYVRLAFAVAAHLEPDILVVDEVLAVGDVEFQKKCIGKMSGAARQGRTVLFVSHNMPAIQSLCTRAVLLDRGAVVADGVVNSVVAQYLDRVASHPSHPSSELRTLERESGMCPVFAKGYLNDTSLMGEHAFLPEPDLHFRFSIELPQPMYRCTMGVHFDDESGIRVYAANTRWQLKHLDFTAGCHSVECRIPRLPLVPGRYHLALGFSADKQQVDWLERIATIEIMKGDVYGTGELPYAGQGYFLSRADWRVS